MKRLFAVIAVILILYSIYYDLNYGTLPASVTEQQAESKTKKSTTESAPNTYPYFEHTVQNGDTVLSIIENQLNHPLPVPISEVVTDFKELNEELPPTQIQPGKSYKFPDYRSEEE